MKALLFDEQFADALDDGNARRGWFTDIQRERSADPALAITSAPVTEVGKCDSLDCDLVHA